MSFILVQSLKIVEVEVECAIEHGNLFGSLSLPCGISEDGSSPKDQDFVQITYHRAEKENRWISLLLMMWERLECFQFDS